MYRSNMINKQRIRNKEYGFTLIEIMTAVSIFTIVTTISMGSILTIFDINRKSESIKIVMDNLNLSVESMAREMRYATRYSCDPNVPIPTPWSQMSPGNCTSGGDSIAFYSPASNRAIVYRQSGTVIEKSINGGQSFTPVTAPEIAISDMDFYVLGALSSASEFGNPQQPKVLIKIRGSAGVKESVETEFTLQTLVSQRQLDNQ
ncbi:MAG: PilW family protein [Minisyncoccota bacterium]